MSKASEAKELADKFNQPVQREKRLSDVVGHVVDLLIEGALADAKRGLYDLSYKICEMEKERIRLANLNEDEVVKAAVEKLNLLGFQANFTRPYINLSWK
jgi:hypothetical protein